MRHLRLPTIALSYAGFAVSCSAILSACTTFSTSSFNSSKQPNQPTPKPKVSSGSKYGITPDTAALLKPLFGLDIQVAFSLQTGSFWTNQKIKFIPIAPGSTGALHGKDTLSIPITSGSLSYQTSPPAAIGVFGSSGGFSLEQSDNSLAVRNLNFDLSTDMAYADINNKYQKLFRLLGPHGISVDRANLVILRRIEIYPLQNESKNLRSYFQPGQMVGIATVDISTTPSG